MPAVREFGERGPARGRRLLAFLILLALLIAGWFGYHADLSSPPAPQAPVPAAVAPEAPSARRTAAPAATPPTAAGAPAPVPAATQPATAPILPSFDIVRVNNRGQAVMAGRAAPGAEVTILDGGQEIARVTADPRGEWVFVSQHPLPPGGRELTLATTGADGMTRTSAAAVVLVVPERGQDIAGRPAAQPEEQRPLALLVPEPGAAPRVLQAPAASSNTPAPDTPAPNTAASETATPGETPQGQPATSPRIPAATAQGTRPPQAGRVNLESVDYDDAGEVRFSGTAPAHTPVRVYVDNDLAGETVADVDGRWTLVPPAPVAPGTHALRVDQIAPQGGRVAARVELPFQRAALPPAALREGKVVVQPGQSLWRIARATYGSGVRYTVIYDANKDVIRDPALIYPGQIFDLPRGAN